VQYARTIFEGHAWEYAQGIPSTGSSAPLWSVILAPIFLLGYARETVVTVVLVISAVFYAVDTSLVGYLVWQYTDRWQVGVLGQVVFILVPRNAGLMLSGMETPLAMLMLLLALILLPRKDIKSDLLLGVVAGLAYLCRPEFVLIAAVCLPARAIWLLYRDRLSAARILSTAGMFLFAALIVAPWVLHCLNTTGLPLPDSYYSKLRWGVSHNDVSLWNFFWYDVWFPTEPYLALGFMGGLVLLFMGRPFEITIATSLFALYRGTMPGMSLLFAARYLVPLFDLLAIAFVAGTFKGVEKLLPSDRKPSSSETERPIVAGLIVLLLFVPSLGSYVQHVDIHANQIMNINEMQVTLSEWVRDNVPEDAVIASYDVGALGYFARCTVIDIYGLVTPEMLHNRTNLADQALFLRELNCDYIMFYEEWFVYLRGAIYDLGGSVQKMVSVHIDPNVVCGTSNMAVYSVTWS
jgi:arabinofuranosyltransferase